MADIFNNFLKQVATGDQIKDYKHASRLFVDNTYALAPKNNWLFHVFFDLNPLLTSINNIKMTEAGMLAKSAELPKFNIISRTINGYNRPNIVQTKIKYDPVRITFHDDMSNVVRNLWFDYYTYYYRDTDSGVDTSGAISPTYQMPHKYGTIQRDKLNQFGYTPRAYVLSNQYIQAIRIYSLHKKRFSEYILVNPIISAMTHGQHNNADDTGLVEITMTIEYETVLYASGYTSPSTVKGFADLHYDKSPSPLTPAGGGTNSIMGPGGIIASGLGIANDLANGNILGAAFTAYRAYEKNKNVDLKKLAANELLQAGQDILNGKNPTDRFFIPNTGILSTTPGTPAGTTAGATATATGAALSNTESVTGVASTSGESGLTGVDSVTLVSAVDTTPSYITDMNNSILTAITPTSTEPVFETGTNSTLVNTTTQTETTALANKTAADFANNGNIVKVNDFSGGTSTPPAPSTLG